MEALRKNHKKLISLKQAKKIVMILVAILFFDFFLFPAPALADQTMKTFYLSQNQADITVSAGEIDQQTMEFNGKLPKNDDVDIKWSKYTVVTAYNSDVGQTDNSPCITANNFNVCDYGVEDTIAANFLPFGSKVKIPELFGDRVFTVRDRMNRRFSYRVDVWMIERPDAVNFGVKLAKIEVLE
ncbi:MAG: hypothetical protein PHS62_02635 [Patescibacteria group bacterium]|nr:hypothetical protein [Patescibacteria group bacterium]